MNDKIKDTIQSYEKGKEIKKTNPAKQEGVILEHFQKYEEEIDNIDPEAYLKEKINDIGLLVSRENALVAREYGYYEDTLQIEYVFQSLALLNDNLILNLNKKPDWSFLNKIGKKVDAYLKSQLFAISVIKFFVIELIASFQCHSALDAESI